VKAKMESKPETASLPAELASTPDDQAVQGAFQYQLRKLLENDEAFAKELQELVEAAKKQSASYSAKLEGDGAIAQGKNARAVGAGGMMIEGGVSGGSVVIQGDHNEVNDGKRRKKD
jgi:hypothetical protein